MAALPLPLPGVADGLLLLPLTSAVMASMARRAAGRGRGKRPTILQINSCAATLHPSSYLIIGY